MMIFLFFLLFFLNRSSCFKSVQCLFKIKFQFHTCRCYFSSGGIIPIAKNTHYFRHFRSAHFHFFLQIKWFRSVAEKKYLNTWFTHFCHNFLFSVSSLVLWGEMKTAASGGVRQGFKLSEPSIGLLTSLFFFNFPPEWNPAAIIKVTPLLKWTFMRLILKGPRKAGEQQWTLNQEFQCTIANQESYVLEGNMGLNHLLQKCKMQRLNLSWLFLISLKFYSQTLLKSLLVSTSPWPR